MLHTASRFVIIFFNWRSSCPLLAGKVYLGFNSALRYSARSSVLAFVRKASGRTMGRVDNLDCCCYLSFSMDSTPLDMDSFLNGIINHIIRRGWLSCCIKAKRQPQARTIQRRRNTRLTRNNVVVLTALQIARIAVTVLAVSAVAVSRITLHSCNDW